MYAAHARYALDDDSCHIAIGNRSLDALDVAEFEEIDWEGGIDRCLNLWVLGHIDSSRSATMESMAKGDDLLLASVERSELERILICLGTRVDEEELEIVVSAHLAQLLCEFHLKRVLDGIAIETELGSLLLHCLQITRMTVTDRDYGMTSVEVEILLTLVVIDVCALAMVNSYIK